MKKLMPFLSVLIVLVSVMPALAGKYSTSASWSDGVGDYSTGSFSISAGMSVPQIPSFSTTNITPTYYFPTDMKVNAAGFTTDAGAFINPTAVAFVDPPKIVDPTTDKRFPQGVAMVTFTNGLDGTMWQASDNTHIPAYVSDMDRQMMDIQPAKATRLMGVDIPTANVAYGEWKGNVNNITYQNIAFLNENLVNSIDANDATVCAQQLAKNPQNIEPMAYNYTNLPGDKVAAIYLTTPDQTAHFSYSTGAYVMPGDLLIGTGENYVKGLGVDVETRDTVWKPARRIGEQIIEETATSRSFYRRELEPQYQLDISQQGNISPRHAVKDRFTNGQEEMISDTMKFVLNPGKGTLADGVASVAKLAELGQIATKEEQKMVLDTLKTVTDIRQKDIQPQPFDEEAFNAQVSSPDMFRMWISAQTADTLMADRLAKISTNKTATIGDFVSAATPDLINVADTDYKRDALAYTLRYIAEKGWLNVPITNVTTLSRQLDQLSDVGAPNDKVIYRGNTVPVPEPSSKSLSPAALF